VTDAPVRRRLGAPERRAQLVDAAVAVLAEVGYQATKADAIAARAGVSKGLLWHYFADLDDLMETRLAKLCSRFAKPSARPSI